MKTVFFLCLVVTLTLPSAFAAPAWKPYDDFEGDLDAIDETPGQIPDLGTKWVRSLIIFRFLGIINREYFITHEEHNFSGVQSLRLCRGTAN